MLFSSPQWLLLLIPWLGLLVWMMRGMSAWEYVPFAQLWPREKVAAARERRLRRPPWDAICILLALLLGILAMAGASVRGPGAVRILIDRGGGLASASRYADACQRAMDLLKSPDQAVEIQFLPGPSITTHAGDARAVIQANRPTALSTAELLLPAMQRSDREFTGPILVVTAQDVAPISPRMLIVHPAKPADNVGIVTLAARESGEVMVRIRNDSDAQSVQLKVTSGAQHAETDVTLPPRGQVKDAFVTLPRLQSSIVAAIDRADDFPLDNRAYLARSTVQINRAPNLPAAVERVLQIYQAQHLADTDSQNLQVATSSSALSPDSIGIAIEPAIQPLQGGAIDIRSGADFIKQVDWSRVARDASVAPEPSDEWQPIVKVGAQTLVARRQGKSTQYSIRVWSNDWISRADFVLFWAGLLEDLAGPMDFSAKPAQELGPDWLAVEQSDPQVQASPGLYRKGSQTMALSIQPIPMGISDTRPMELPSAPANGSSGLARGLLTVALVLLGVGVIIGLNRPSSPANRARKQ